jgi:alpha,alpha-trehalase
VARVVREIVPQFEHVGGMVSTLPLSDGEDGGAWLPRQWDYPYGWAPHQILVWDGLRRYGYEGEARRLAYRWLFLLTRTFVEYCGRMTERYDVVQERTVVDSDGAEYGNQGSKFEGVNIEGYVFVFFLPAFRLAWCFYWVRADWWFRVCRFGWTNSSYQYGMKIIGPRLMKALRKGVVWEDIESIPGDV